MTDSEFARKLNEMRAAGQPGRRITAMTHLFGFLFDREIENSGSNAARIAREAGISGAEAAICDGRNLADWVTVKPEVRRRWGPGG